MQNGTRKKPHLRSHHTIPLKGIFHEQKNGKQKRFSLNNSKTIFFCTPKQPIDTLMHLKKGKGYHMTPAMRVEKMAKPTTNHTFQTGDKTWKKYKENLDDTVV